MKIFCLHMKKVNKKKVLWQKPKTKHFDKFADEWFDNAPVGCDPLNESMKNLFKNAELSNIYMNHCIWASVVTSLDEQGFEAHHIMAITGHKSENSFKSYASKCPERKRGEMIDALVSNLIQDELQNKVAHLNHASKEATSTVSMPTECNNLVTLALEKNNNQLEIEFPGDNNDQNFPLFPNFDDIPDDLLVNTLTQNEKENMLLMQGPNETNVTVTKESAKTLNY